jgi:hypothetical protein
MNMNHRELLTWGPRGLRPLSALRHGERVSECDTAMSVRGVCDDGHLLYVLRRDGLHVLDNNLCEVGFAPIDDPRKVTIVADRLAVINPQGLSVFDLCKPEAPRFAGIFPMPNIDTVGRAPGGRRRRAVFVRKRPRGGKVIDLTIAETPVEIAEFSQRPWFVEGARLGRLFVRLDENLRHISIYRMERMNAGYERPPLASEIWSRQSDAGAATSATR